MLIGAVGHLGAWAAFRRSGDKGHRAVRALVQPFRQEQTRVAMRLCRLYDAHLDACLGPKASGKGLECVMLKDGCLS
jgi:hypothetical protein